jgi:ribosomal protein S18 acetylase RimI-like enzyme
MQIDLLKISSNQELECIQDLYLSAFPAKERRDLDDLKLLLAERDCSIYKVLTGNEVFAGFCVVWKFPGFVFLEHFAIEPHLRGLGIGERTLAAIKSLFLKPVILETEIPVDEISQRRIRFYERNGFHKLNRHYFQPSYGGNKPEVELKLMCTNVDIPADELDFMIRAIRKKVYGVE